MQQRGRKSAESQAIAPNLPDLIRAPSPFGHMTDAAQEVWRATVANLPADWFAPEQLPILEKYCRHVVTGRQIDEELEQCDPEWLRTDDGLKRFDRLTAIRARETTAIKALATALRLTNQSRYMPRGAGRTAAKTSGARKPWETLEG